MIAERSVGTSDLYAGLLSPRETATGGKRPQESPVAPVPPRAAAEKDPSAENTVPNVAGYSVRRAVALLVAKDLEPVVKGSGIVVAQNPAAGMPATKGMKVVLTVAGLWPGS